MTDRIGVLFSVRDDLGLVECAEELGYNSIWAAEGQGKTAFGKLERWATVTSDVGLATGIVNIFARSPAAVAQAIATLDTHSDGRAILGLGVAHPGVVETFHGNSFERPLPRMEEYIRLVRRYLRGESDEFDGEFFSPRRTSFWDAFEPVREDIPIYNAALGPGNVRLTGEHADGWLPNLYPLDRFETAKDWLETGAERGGRDVSSIDIAMYLLAAADDDREAARVAARRHVAYYLRNIPGYYGRVAENAGFEDDVRAVEYADSLDKGATQISDSFLDVVALAGTPEEVQNRLATIRDKGVNLPIVRAPIDADKELVTQTLNVFAP